MTIDQKTYLLLDNDGAAIAQAKVEGSTDTDNWQMKVLDGKIDDVAEYETVRLMSITDCAPSYEGKVMRCRNDMVQLEVKRIVSTVNDKRKNLRVPTGFKSYIYPVSGRWRGRRDIKAIDISCGGIAFFNDGKIDRGEVIEVVVSVTAQPLIVRCEILRTNESESGDRMYAGKFVGLCEDEEVFLRESVFALQFKSRPRRNRRVEPKKAEEAASPEPARAETKAKRGEEAKAKRGEKSFLRFFGR